MRRGRCRIIASTLGCLVCDKTLTCFLFKTVQMLITMHVALLAFYFNMLIYVEIDVCVVPNWSYVMICDRMFNLKTTCVKKKYLWLIFYLYIWHKFVLFRVGFCFVLCRTFTAGLDWPAECWKRFGKIDFYLFIFFFFFFKSAMWDYRDEECTHVWLMRILFLLREILFRAKRSRGSRPGVWDATHQKL